MPRRISFVFILLLGIAGCSTLKPRGDFNPTATSAAAQTFNISGKVGVRYERSEDTRSDTAFYQWQQQGSDFSLRISGALGIGATHISGSSTSAVLVNKDSRIEATSASELLQKATGWQAPLESMTYWISAQSAPQTSADKNQFDSSGRLIQTQVEQWVATLNYQDEETLPSRIKATQTGSVNRVILSINSRAK